MAATMTGRRVTRLAKILVDALWWVSLVLLAFGALFAILVALEVRDGTVTTAVRVSVPAHLARGIMALASPIPNVGAAPELTGLEGMLEIRVTWWIVLLASTVVVPTVMAFLYAFHLLRTFLRDVLADRVFTEANARRLAHLGWLLAAAGTALPVLEYVYGWAALRYAGVSGFAPKFDSSPIVLLAGLLFLVVAAAWRYGAQLQQDHDLTV